MNTPDAALEPCPFCGSTKLDRLLFPPATEDPAARQTGMVSCGNCLAVGPTESGQSLDEAIARWNMRGFRHPILSTNSPERRVQQGENNVLETPTKKDRRTCRR